MNPYLPSIVRLSAGVPAVTIAAVVLALALGVSTAQAARTKYETTTVSVSLAGKNLPEDVYVSGPITRMPALAPEGKRDRLQGSQFGDVLLSGRLPVPEAVEAWFSKLETGRDARDTLLIELTNHTGDAVCSWEIIDAIPYRLDAEMKDTEKTWTLHIATQQIRYVGKGSPAKASVASTSTSTPGTDASRAQQTGSKAGTTGGPGVNAGSPRTQRPLSTTRPIGAGNIEPSIPGSAPVIRPPSLPRQVGSSFAVTTADGKVHQVANIIPSDDRKLITLVMADQKRVTFDRNQIKKIDRLNE